MFPNHVNGVSRACRVKNVQWQLCCAQQKLKHGWSRTVLMAQIQTDAYKRRRGALPNFKHSVSATVQQSLKGLYAIVRRFFGPDKRVMPQFGHEFEAIGPSVLN